MGDDTPPTGGWAPMVTLERYHTEDNAWRANHIVKHEALDARLNALEKVTERIEVRLGEGVKTFAEVKQEIVDIKKTTSMPIWKIAVIVVAIVSPIAALAFNAARYPTREEFDRMKIEVDQLRLDEAMHHSEIMGKLNGRQQP